MTSEFSAASLRSPPASAAREGLTPMPLLLIGVVFAIAIRLQAGRSPQHRCELAARHQRTHAGWSAALSRYHRDQPADGALRLSAGRGAGARSRRRSATCDRCPASAAGGGLPVRGVAHPASVAVTAAIELGRVCCLGCGRRDDPADARLRAARTYRACSPFFPRSPSTRCAATANRCRYGRS